MYRGAQYQVGNKQVQIKLIDSLKCFC